MSECVSESVFMYVHMYAYVFVHVYVYVCGHSQLLTTLKKLKTFTSTTPIETQLLCNVHDCKESRISANSLDNLAFHFSGTPDC